METNLTVAGVILAVLTIPLLNISSCRPNSKMASFQGYMEGELVLVGPEEGGRIERVFVKQGDSAKEGQLLFQIENSLEISQRRQAKSVLAEAEAGLENLQSEQMRAQEVEVLKAREQNALAALQLAKEDLDRKQQLFERGTIPRAQLDAALTAYERSKAALDEARGQIGVAHLAAREQQIDAAAANVAAAKAALQQAEIRLQKKDVRSPTAGRVEELNFRAGEVVTPGQPVVALLPPGNVKVRFFVPEGTLSQVAIGTVVEISCDGCPPDLSARIDFIARKAEFTPPVIYGPKERAKLVFRVEARPDEQAAKLSPGQPVTVTPLDAEASK